MTDSDSKDEFKIVNIFKCKHTVVETKVERVFSSRGVLFMLGKTEFVCSWCNKTLKLYEVNNESGTASEIKD